MVLSVGMIAVIGHVYKATRLPDELRLIQQADEQPNDPDADQDAEEHEKTLSRVQQIDLEATVTAVSLVLLSISLLSVQMSRNIAKPIQTLESAMSAFAEGDLSTRVPPIPLPELHRLGLRFNHLSASLQGVEERRRRMISDLAHELRTPLTVIQGHLMMAQDGIAELTPESQALLIQETQRVDRLVSDLLELSKIEAGYLPLNPKKFSAHRVLNGIVLTFSVKALQSNCQLKLIQSNNQAPIYADPDRFQQIVINLLNNAITYTPNGAVTISSATTPGFAWFSIQDTGVGIASEDLPSVFDRFWRADRSRNQNTGGSGIGLAIAKRLVELQGGTIEVESTLGEGTTFRFSMPLARYVQCQDCPHQGSLVPCNLETCPLTAQVPVSV
jgi:signal transduction histidine kinase